MTPVPKSKKPRKPRPRPQGGGGSSARGGGQPNMQQMLAQVQQMQEDMLAAQEELADEQVEATAGGGMVTVLVNGRQEVLSVRIDPEAVDPDDVDMLQDLVVAGVNEALRKAKEIADERLGGATGGVDLGGMGNLLGGLG